VAIDQTEVRAPAMSRPEPARVRVIAPWLGALAAGAALLLAFPPYGQWWLAPIGVALLALAVRGRRVRTGLALGLLCGVVLFVPLLSWTGLHVGPVPWLILAVFEASYLGLMGAAAAYCSVLLDRWPWAYAPLTAVLWVAQEALRGRYPFGGFPWGRLAFSQAGGPLLRLAALGGAPLVTAGVALLGGLLAGAVHPPRPGWLARAGDLSSAVAVAALAMLIPVARPAGPTVTVAIVQGNVPRLGFDFNAQRRAVLDNHVEATLGLARQVAAGTAAQPDLVIWPENASDIDPLANPDASERISAAADAIKAPVLVGAVLDGPGDRVRNAGLVWLPGSGPGELYVKRHPVPFAEYVPMRSIARMVSSDVDLVASEFQAGSRPGVLRLGPATVGDVICFEVAYDGLVADTVNGGAQLIAVQTNNATFNSAEALQQLAMVRLRAVEHGRAALMASTVGVSAFVGTDGGVHQATAFDKPAVVVDALRLGSARTLATRLGAGPEYGMSVLAVAAVLIAVAIRIRSRRSGDDAGKSGHATSEAVG
jgi:apolipoprotein N-acyltransferase